MSTRNQLDLQTLGSQPIMPKNLPNHWKERVLSTTCAREVFAKVPFRSALHWFVVEKETFSFNSQHWCTRVVHRLCPGNNEGGKSQHRGSVEEEPFMVCFLQEAAEAGHWDGQIIARAIHINPTQFPPAKAEVGSETGIRIQKEISAATFIHK